MTLRLEVNGFAIGPKRLIY